MNWKVYGRKWLQPNVKYYLNICPERVRKIIINVTHNSQSLDQHFKPGTL